MRKLLLAAILATLGLARAAEPSAAPQAGADATPARTGAKAQKPPRKDGAKPAATPAVKDAPPAKAPGAEAAKPEPVPPARTPAQAKPCEPVKPCPIDG